MFAHSQFGSSSFNRVAKGLVALHRLIQEGKDDSPEAEAVRDALDVPLKALSEAEKQRAQWLSEDLYSVSDPPATAPKELNPQAQRQLNEAFEARQARRWDQALALLRRWREFISPALLSYLRGSIWLEAGNPDVAAMFYGHASQRDPANASYRAIYLYALAESDPESARELAEEMLADDGKHPPVVIARAADILFNQTKTLSDAESVRRCRELIPILERNMARIEQDEEAASMVSAYAMTVCLLGFCYELQGNTRAAVDCYTRGIRANPDNDALLVARAILEYGASPRSIQDFEQAVRLRSPVVWPYLFLAHHYLITTRFEQCRAMCEAGVGMRGSDAAKSQLEQWRAIAQAELGFPPDLVRSAFEAALRLDPSNELARRNLDAFEASLKAPHARVASAWEPRSQAAVRQFAMAERVTEPPWPVAA